MRKKPATRGVRVTAVVVGSLLLVFRAGAAEEAEVEMEAEPEGSRTSQSGYDQISQFGGPDGVSGQLRSNDELREAGYDVVWLQSNWRPYFDWKRQLKDNRGIAFGINMWGLYQAASAVKPGTDDNALGGIFRFQGVWKLLGRNGGGSSGRLEWRVETRGNIGDNVAPATLGDNVGTIGLNTGFPYNESFHLDVSVLNWTQGFIDNRVGYAVGRLAFDAYLDANPFQTPAGGFLNRGLFLNPTLPTTGVGALGLVAEAFVTENIRIGGQIYDANAKNGNWDYDAFQESEFIKAAEIGWSPSRARHKTDLVQLTYWTRDRLDTTGTPQSLPGHGLAMTATWQFERWAPFFRYGNSNGDGGVAAKEYAATGFKMQAFFDQLFSAGAAWSEPSDQTLRDEYVVEFSYVYQLSQNLSLTPDIQLVVHPADNPADSNAWVLGLRALLRL
jgi:porin